MCSTGSKRRGRDLSYLRGSVRSITKNFLLQIFGFRPVIHTSDNDPGV